MSHLAGTLMPKMDALSSLCAAATGQRARDPAAEAAMLQAYIQGCADGWLPDQAAMRGCSSWGPRCGLHGHRGMPATTPSASTSAA
jgi:hypothetical protein